jgi:ABC-type branched-subunit amino acid transport system ATPase component
MDDVTLPDFAILTGANASGKTRLFKAIETGSVRAETEDGPLAPPSILYLSQLVPTLSLSFKLATAEGIELQLINSLHGMKSRPSHRRAQGLHQTPRPTLPPLEAIAKLLGKPAVDLLDEDVEAFAVALSASAKAATLGYDLATISMGYIRTYYHQLRARAIHAIGDRSVDSVIEPSKLVTNHEPPWVLVSEILERFGFSVQGPDITLQQAQRDLELTLTIADGKAVPPEQLSGGEQALLALALAQYTVANGGAFPQLLLLDESLSSLHPATVARALRAIEDVFVAKNKTRVLLVTHAPTVVALAPPASTYVVMNEAPRLTVRPAATDECIGLLCVGVPALRIDLMNRHQVLVEGGIDEYAYSRLFDAARPQLPPERTLGFLASGAKGESSRERVVELVRGFRERGNPRVFGIVDDDGVENAKLPPGVLPLCAGERDALENLLLDPVTLAFVLASTEKGRAESGGYTQRQLDDMPPKDFQGVVDGISARLAEKAKGIPQGERIEVEYVGSYRFTLPKWTLRTDGHKYAEIVLSTFPHLQDKLMAAVAADHLPNIRLPQSLVAMFKTLLSLP